MAKMIPPPWYALGVRDLGQHETGNNAGPYIKGIIVKAKCGNIGDPWCAIQMNAWLEESGFPGTRSASSQSFRHDANFIPLSGPALGAIAVFWRTSRASGLGHVCMYDGQDGRGFINGLGGNESDEVRRELLNPAGQSFGLRGYYWPRSAPLPVIGKLPVTQTSKGAGKVV